MYAHQQQHGSNSSLGRTSPIPTMTNNNNPLLQWVNEIMMNTLHTNAMTRRQINQNFGGGGGGADRGGVIVVDMSSSSKSAAGNGTVAGSSPSAMTNLPLQTITDLSSFDYAQLIVALRPSTNTRFTFSPSNNTPREIYEAHMRNYRNAVSEMSTLIQQPLVGGGGATTSTSTNINASSSSSTTNPQTTTFLQTLPQRLCQGDLAAHTSLLAAIYTQRRTFPSLAEYDWVRQRQKLEEKELMPDGRPLAWNNANGGKGGIGGSSSTDDPKRFIDFKDSDRQTYQLLTNTTAHLERSLKAALSLAPYLCVGGVGGTTATTMATISEATPNPLEAKDPIRGELFELMLLALGETNEEAAAFYP